MKTYVLTVSRLFPCTHKRKGEQTFFAEKIHDVIMPISETPFFGEKIHTIRANYDFWAKRIEQIQKGEAILSIRYWSGKPYNSKQVEICQLDKDSGIGVQEIWFSNSIDFPRVRCSDKNILALIPRNLAKNDGLSFDDFKEWFRKYDLSKPMVIIHLTKFRY